MKPRPRAVVLPLLLAAGIAQTLTAAEPFRDPSLPLEQRVDDLVSRLTLDEKIAVLGQVQPAIPKLEFDNKGTNDLPSLTLTV